MALYYLHIKSISRGAGRSAPGAAAYRAGERIRDERTGVLYNYSRRRDVRYAEILLPSRWSSAEVPWARDRARLWNGAEAAEHRRNSRVAREIQVTLPPELSASERLELARRFSRELADRHDVAVDLAIHEPRPDGDPRNHHAHLLATTRELHASGFGAKTGLDMQESERRKRDLCPGVVELVAIRERWATLTNEALRDAGLTQRVDHRSLKAQGIDREPLPHIPYVAYRLERLGLRSEVAERIRAQYRARVAAREGLRPAVEPSRREPDPAPSALAAIEDLRRRSRDAWLALRGEVPQRGESARSMEPSRNTTADSSRAQAAVAPERRHDAPDTDFSI
ncbi:MAG: MobQ family relaxase [Steroidobacteraceae bacterium]|jgi:ATP-dependent exoDNAse (exonuclease V) alpha subunit